MFLDDAVGINFAFKLRVSAHSSAIPRYAEKSKYLPAEPIRVTPAELVVL